MHRLRPRITYANTMSTLAVFLVLSGASAYAATHLGRNSVGSKQLKRNAVTAAKIKRNAISGAKIKTGAVTGAKIKAGSLGEGQLGVGSVGNAETQLVKVFKGKAVAAAESATSAPKIELGSVGPFKFYGKCFRAGPVVFANTYIELTSGAATLGAAVVKMANVYLTPGMPESERLLAGTEADANSIGQDSGRTFEAAATDGTIIAGIGGGGAVKNGTIPAGDGPFPAGDSCVIGNVAVFGG